MLDISQIATQLQSSEIVIVSAHAFYGHKNQVVKDLINDLTSRFSLITLITSMADRGQLTENQLWHYERYKNLQVISAPWIGEDEWFHKQSQRKALKDDIERLKAALQPKVVWLHQRHGLEWVYLTLGVNCKRVLTVYEAWYVCPKRTRVYFDGTFCEGIKSAEDCVQCIYQSKRLDRQLAHKLIDLLTVMFHQIPFYQSWYSGKNNQPNIILTWLDKLSVNHLVRRRKHVSYSVITATDLLISPTASLMKQIISQFSYRNDTLILEWPVKQNQNTLTRKKQVPRPVYRLTYVGRLSPEKGILTLIKSLYLIQPLSQRHLLLELYGRFSDTAYERKVTQKITNLNHTRGDITISYKQWTDNIFSVLNYADAIVIPSECWDNLPAIALEAKQISNLSIIISNIPGIRESLGLEDQGVFLFSQGNHVSLAHTIEKVLRLTDASPEWERPSKQMDVRDYVQNCLNAMQKP